MDNFELLFGYSRKNSSQDTSWRLSPEFLEKSSTQESFQLLIKSLEFLKAKNYSAAMVYINEAIILDTNNSFFYKVRGSIKEDSGDKLAAIDDFKESLSIGGDSYSTYHSIGLNYIHLKDFKKALQAFDVAIALKEGHNTDFGLDCEKGQLPVWNGVVLVVSDETMYANRANVKFNLKDFRGCYDDCDIAIKRNPEYSTSYVIAGILFLQLNKREEAYRIFKMAESKGNTSATYILQKELSEFK